MSLGTKSFATQGVHHKVHDKVRDKVHDKVHNKAHDKVHDKRSWYQDLGTKSLEEPVLHDGGTAVSAYPIQYPFFIVRTPQANLVGEKSECKIFSDLGILKSVLCSAILKETYARPLPKLYALCWFAIE